uniref:Uncharacterized protein n=1 Tax=Rhizophora mucronata TaxID=61149 RepID=A0A2P2R2G1_RHIMU
MKTFLQLSAHSEITVLGNLSGMKASPLRPRDPGAVLSSVDSVILPLLCS